MKTRYAKIRRALAEKFGDWMYLFTEDVNEHYKRTYHDYPIRQLKDGTIYTSTLYYKVARDARNGKLNVYWARDPNDFQTEEKEVTLYDVEGKRHVKKIREFVHQDRIYHCATLRPGAYKTDIREAISEHHRKFRDFAINEMAHHGGDVSHLVGQERPEEEWETHGKYYKVIGFTNKRWVISVHELPEGGWSLCMGPPVKWFNRKTQFSPMDGIDPTNKIVKTIMSNGYPYKNRVFDSKGEALAYMDLLKNQKSQDVWTGFDPIKFTDAPVTNATTTAWNFIAEEVMSVDNSKDAAADAALVPFLGPLSFPVSQVMRRVKGVIVFSAEQALIKTRGIGFSMSKRAPYVANTPENMRRSFNTKPNPESFKYLDVLEDSDAIDITNFGQAQEKQESSKHLKALKTKDGSGFTMTSSLGSLDVSTQVYMNGQVRLSYYDQKRDRIVTYSQYIEAFNFNGKIPLTKEERRILEGLKTVRLDQSADSLEVINHGRHYHPSEIIRQVEASIDDYYQNEELAAQEKRHIRWLFAQSSEKTQRPFEDDNTIDDRGLMKGAFGHETDELPKPSKALIEFMEKAEFSPLVDHQALDIHAVHQPLFRENPKLAA